MDIDGINHVTLRVRNLEVSDDFYSNVLGLKRVGERKGMRFYSSGRHAHELALVHDPLYEDRGNNGLLHVCFNLRSEAALTRMYRRCKRHGLLVSQGVDHIVMYSFYLRDPDGHTIELGVDRPESAWGEVVDPFAEDRVLDLDRMSSL